MAGELILIVDDTLVSLKLTRALLVHDGYQVITAATAEEGLQMARQHRPAVVLADIMLPGMDGLEMTRLLKQDDRTRGIRVVALTACSTEDDRKRTADAGCDGYLTKPVDPLTLRAGIRGVLHDGAPAVESLCPEAPAPLLQDTTLVPLRKQFLEEGRAVVQTWEVELDGIFDGAKAAFIAHQWVGAAGMLGYSEISRVSRELEMTLRERPIDLGEARESIAKLRSAFDAASQNLAGRP